MALDYEVGTEYQSSLGEVMASVEVYSLSITTQTEYQRTNHPITNQRITSSVETADSTKNVRIKADLVYMGLEDSVMKMKYREFMGENYILRESFELDLDYDLSESRIIIFRGLTIDVLHISPSAVTYQILADEGNSLLPLDREMTTTRGNRP